MPEHVIKSSRCLGGIQSGNACGPVSNETVVAEAVIEENGKNLYITGEWIDEVAETISFEITEKPIADILSAFATADLDELGKIRKTGKLLFDYGAAMKSEYADVCKILANMISDKLAASGFFDEEIEEDEELPEWYTPTKS